MDGALLAAHSFTSVNANFHQCKKRKIKTNATNVGYQPFDRLSQCGS